MKPLLSVIIPTYNPNRERLNRTIEALKKQNLDYNQWELILVDNHTPDINYLSSFDLSWHPQSKLITEERLGLTWARIAGIESSSGEYIVFVDDDNVLDRDYLQYAIDILEHNPNLGSIGGKSIPEFEVTPEPWFDRVNLRLGCRDLGNETQVYTYQSHTDSPKEYPKFAPIGAGMVLRRAAINIYVQKILSSQQNLISDRKGKNLSSGGDCDINLTLIDAGWSVGYFPQLKLTHLISANRLTKNYLGRLNRALMRSWVQILDRHGIRPWSKIPRWTVILRQIKAFFRDRPWQDPAAYIRWQGSCGMFEGQADLPFDIR